MKQQALVENIFKSNFRNSCSVKYFKDRKLFFVLLRQNKVKGLPSNQSPRLNQKLIYAMKLQLKIDFKT